MKSPLLIFSLLVACGKKTTDERPEKTTEIATNNQQQSTANQGSAQQQNNPNQKVKKSCDIMAYVADKDPKGLNVRATPSAKNTKILGQLPTKNPVDVRLVESQKGWFRITAASDIKGGKDMPQTGWVHGKLLGIGIRNYGPKSEFFLHEKPDKNSKTVGDPELGPATLLECQGKWLKVNANRRSAGCLLMGSVQVP